MRLRSVRLRLTLWNVLILGLVLCVFGLAVYFSVKTIQSNAVDRELQERVHAAIAGDLSLGGPSEGTGPTAVSPTPSRRPRMLTGAEYRRPRALRADGTGEPPFPEDRPWDWRAFFGSMEGRRVFRTVEIDGEPFRVYSAPVRRSGVVVGVVQAAQPLEDQNRLLGSLVQTLLILIPPAAFAAALAALFLTTRALRPVREVTAAAAALSVEGLSSRLKVHGDDEFAELARTFNGMMVRLEQAFAEVAYGNRALQDAYKKLANAYHQQRRFTGDASHELRTPLTRIKGSTSLALGGAPDLERYRKALLVADEAADAMSRLVQDLLLLARSDAGQLPLRTRVTGLDEILHRALQGLPDEAAAPVLVDIPEDLPPLVGDPEHLSRLFLNLIQNALRHTPVNGGEVRVSGILAEGKLLVSVVDNGEGIAPEHLPHLTERFYRVDSARSGHTGGAGLGLAICETIVRAHGGSMWISSTRGEGTKVTVSLPPAEPVAPPERKAEAALAEPLDDWQLSGAWK